MQASAAIISFFAAATVHYLSDLYFVDRSPSNIFAAIAIISLEYAERHISCNAWHLSWNFFLFVDLDFAYLKPAVFIYFAAVAMRLDSFALDHWKICFFYIDVLNLLNSTGKLFPCLSTLIFHVPSSVIYCGCMFKMVFSPPRKEMNAVNMWLLCWPGTDIIICDKWIRCFVNCTL